MACDFTIAQDLARFGQAGPKHGSAPIGGATDFLPVVIGAERAMAACGVLSGLAAPRDALVRGGRRPLPAQAFARAGRLPPSPRPPGRGAPGLAPQLSRPGWPENPRPQHPG